MTFYHFVPFSYLSDICDELVSLWATAADGRVLK